MAYEDHARWDELAVGHALSALEPEDEDAFLRHLRTCSRCARTVAETSDVLASLAGAVEPVTPPESLRRDVLARVDAEESGSGEPADRAEGQPESVHPGRRGNGHRSRGGRRGGHRERGSRTPWYAAAAATVAAVVLAVGNVVQLMQDGAGTGAGQRQLALARQVVDCVERPGCRTVPLRATEDGSTPATALVRDGRVQVLADGLRVNDADATMYVLWQKSGGELRPVGKFDVTRPGAVMVAGGGLDAPLAQTSALAISHEKGDTMPSEPSSPIAVGSVSS